MLLRPNIPSILPSNSKEKLDTLLKSSIPSNGVPGAVVLALSRDGSTIYEGVAGTRGMEDSKEMTSDTVRVYKIQECEN